MRKVFGVFVALFLISVVYSCGGRASFCNKLLLADSLIIDNPDSSWTILQGMKAENLDNLNKSYYNLLVAESGYKSFKKIDGDSAISASEVYFYKNKEKYPLLHARSLLYKGCLEEELKKQISAMQLYVRAKDESEYIDVYTYGYSLYRIASVYHNQYLMGDTAISYYKKALQCFIKCGNRRLQRACMGEIGRLYRSQNADSASVYLNGAIRLAEELDDKYRTACYNTILAGNYYWNGDCLKAKDIAVQNINKLNDFLDIPDCFCFAALAYIKLGNMDSARIMLKMTPPARNIADSVLIYSAKAKYYMNVGQFDKSYAAYERGDELNDSILTHSLRSEIAEMEKKVEVANLRAENKKINDKYYIMCIVAFMVILLLLISVIIFQRLRNRYILALQEMDSINEDLTDTVGKLSDMKEILARAEEKDDELERILDNQVSSIKELIELSNEYECLPEIFMKKFRKAMKISDNNTYWCSLIKTKYGDVLSKIQQDNPNLTKLEMNFMSLMCCELSYTIIMVCMGYESIKSVYNKKALITKKIGVNDLETYLNELKILMNDSEF